MKKLVLIVLATLAFTLALTSVSIPPDTCAGFMGKPGQPSGILCH